MRNRSPHLLQLINLHSYLLFMHGGFNSPRWEPILFGYYLSSLSPMLGHAKPLHQSTWRQAVKNIESHSFLEGGTGRSVLLPNPDFEGIHTLKQENHPGVSGPQSQQASTLLSSRPASEEQTCRSTN